MIDGQWHRFTEEEIKYRTGQQNIVARVEQILDAFNEGMESKLAHPILFSLWFTNMPNVVIVFSNQTDAVNSTLTQLDYTLN